MRAFFKPHYCVLSAVFRPTSLDALSFVDYCQGPPVVVLDNVPDKGKRFAPKTGLTGSARFSDASSRSPRER